MNQARAAGLDLHREVISDAAAFAALAEHWNRLYHAAPRATPFQAHSWLEAWWQAYGDSGRLRVVVVWSQGRLVAAAPLFLVNRGPVRVLLPLGGDISDFVDILVEERDSGGETSTFLASLLAGLLSQRDWDVLDLPEVRSQAAAELLTEQWPGDVHRMEASTCMELPVTDFQQLLLTLPTKRAREVRRVLRRSAELDLVVEDVPPAEIAGAVRELLRLHAMQWEGRGGNPEHQRPRYAQHLSHALTQMVQQGQAAVVRYELEGEVLAGQIVLLGHDLIGGYLLGVAPELYARMDFSTYVVRADIERALSINCSTYNMLRGQESYKERWQAAPAVNNRLLLTRPFSPFGPVFTLAVRARARGLMIAKEKAPWLRQVKDSYLQVKANRRRR